MKRLRSLALCIVLAVTFGYIGYNHSSAASVSDNSKKRISGGSLASLSDSNRSATGSASTVLNRDVVIVSDAADCVAPLYERAVFSVTARGEQLRYQWQVCDPKTNLWVAVSEQYVGAFSGATDSTFSFAADAYTKNGLMFRCEVTDVYGNTAVSSHVSLRMTHGNAAVINAADFGADGSDGRDDSLAIQAAFDFAKEYADEQHPVTVRLSDGKYTIAQTLFVSSHIRFVLSDGAELHYCGDNGCMLQGGGSYGRDAAGNKNRDYQALTDVTISGGRWNAEACAGEVLTAPIVLMNASDICLCDLEIRQSSCHSIMLVSVDDIKVSGCTFRDSVATGDEIPYVREAVFIGYMENNDGQLMPSRNVTVSNCVFDSIHGGVGVRYIGEAAQAFGITQVDDVFHMLSADGEDVTEQSTVKAKADEVCSTLHVAVQKCVFRGLSASCINADGVTGLTVEGCRASDCGAFLYAYCAGGTVTANVVEGTGARCISLTGGSVVNVADNRLSQVGKKDVPARFQSKGKAKERALMTTETEWRMICDALNRACRSVPIDYVSDTADRRVPSVNAREINGVSEAPDGVIAVYYSDSMGSVTGNTVTDVDGRGVLVENSTSLTVISDNTFRGVKETDIYTSGSKAAAMRNRLDGSAESVVMEPISADGVKRDCYSQNQASSVVTAVVMQSESVYASDGEIMGFSVAAQGSGLNYQWYYRPKNGCFWSVWHGHTSAAETAVASPFWNGKQICCVIKDQDGRSVATQPIGITLRPRIFLTEQPENVIVKAGDQVTFWVDAFGLGNQFQWYYRTKNDLTWAKWTAPNQKDLSARATAAWNDVEVYCRVSDAWGGVNSTVVTASVIPPFGILSHPQNVVADDGTPLSFAVEACGKEVEYRWYYRASCDDFWKLLVDETRSEVQTVADASWNGGQVYCAISDAYGRSMASNTANVTVRGAVKRSTKRISDLFACHDNVPKLLSQPEDITVREGEDATVSIEVSGSDLRWQWCCRKAATAIWHPLKGYDTPSVNLPSDVLSDGMQVRCEVRDGTGHLVVSKPALIRVISAPVIVEQPVDVNVTAGEKTVFSVKAMGTKLQYQWYRRLSGDVKWSVWQGHTASCFEEEAALSWNGMQVCCVVTDCNEMQTTSEASCVTVGDGLVITEQPENVSVPVGGRFTFAVNAKGDGVSCQWYYLRPGSRKWTIWDNKDDFTVCAVARPSWDGMQVCCVLTDRWEKRTVSQAATVRLQHGSITARDSFIRRKI